MDDVRGKGNYQKLCVYSEALYSCGFMEENSLAPIREIVDALGDREEAKLLLRRAEIFNDHYGLLMDVARSLQEVLYTFVQGIRASLSELPDLLDFFPEYVFKRNGGKVLHLIFARELVEEERDRWRQNIYKTFGHRKVLCKFSVEEEMIGGMKIYSDSNVLDYSLLSFVHNML